MVVGGLYAGDDHDAQENDLHVLRRSGDLIPLVKERMALLLHHTSPEASRPPKMPWRER